MHIIEKVEKLVKSLFNPVVGISRLDTLLGSFILVKWIQSDKNQ